MRENSKNIVKQLAEILEHGRELFDDKIQLTILNNMEWYENVSRQPRTSIIFYVFR